jgi:hypothetical protein
MTSASISVPKVTRQLAQRGRLSNRAILLLGGALSLVLALLVIGQAIRAYSVTFERFRSIAEDSTAKVDAAEAALQYVADMDTRAAIFVATAPDNPIHWQSQDAIHASFQKFREEMYIVRARLDHPDQSDNPETVDYDKVEYFSFDQFWQHLGNLLTAQQNGDNATALSEYIIADNYLQNQINRYLLDLEALNFQAMEDTERGAATAINGQIALLALVVIVLAVVLTALSFWLRNRVRRVLTPGIDLAMALGWLLALLMIVDLIRTPGLLGQMVEDSYYSVSASARVLAIASQANSAQSGSVIDPGHATFWQQAFDADANSIALRLCGHPGCLSASFTNGSTDPNASIMPGVSNIASQISPADSAAIGGIKPLVAKVNYSGEAAALEQARQAFSDYEAANAKVRDLITAKNLDDASRTATGSNPEQSGEAFARFNTAMTSERDLNRAQFDNIWQAEESGLPLHEGLFGVGGYILAIIGLALGVYHRFREL